MIDSSRAPGQLKLAQGIRLTRNDSQQVVPATTHATAVLLDELLEGDAHLLLHRAGLVDMPANAEQLGAWSSARGLSRLYRRVKQASSQPSDELHASFTVCVPISASPAALLVTS